MNVNPETTVQNLLASGQREERNKKPSKAIDLYTLAVNLDPNCEEAVKRISNIFRANQEHKNAIKPLTYLTTISKKAHEAYFNLAACYKTIGDFENAKKNYLSAIEKSPTFWVAYSQYADVLIRQNCLDQAYEFINQSRKEHGVKAELEWAMARIKVKERNYSDAIRFFRQAVELKVNKHVYPLLLSEFAFALEKTGKYDESFKNHCRAQSLFKQRISGNKTEVSVNDHAMTKSTKFIKRETCSSWTKNQLDDYLDPIFIVGFPRSGTTLCEQVLQSHSKLIATDELEVIKLNIKYTSEILGKSVSYLKDWGKLNDGDIVKWRAKYFEEMSKRIPNYSTKKRIVDKSPIQIVHLATIRRFFPNSPIIMMKRDPRDSCLSSFFQSFNQNAMTNNFYDIKSTFKYYARVMKCYLHLKAELDLNLLEIKYEEMCENFESHAKVIIDHIGESWEDNVLEYYKERNARFVSTPSYAAITNPINNEAVGKWYHYKNNIKPYVSILRPFIEDFGYEYPTLEATQ